MKRYKGKCDIFFGIEHRLRKPRKDGDLQLTQQESPMKEQAVRIESIHQEESLWQLTAVVGAVVGVEEAATDSISGNEGRIAQAWVNWRRRFACFLGVLLALRRVDPEI